MGITEKSISVGFELFDQLETPVPLEKLDVHLDGSVVEFVVEVKFLCLV